MRFGYTERGLASRNAGWLHGTRLCEPPSVGSSVSCLLSAVALSSLAAGFTDRNQA